MRHLKRLEIRFELALRLPDNVAEIDFERATQFGCNSDGHSTTSSLDQSQRRSVEPGGISQLL